VKDATTEAAAVAQQTPTGADSARRAGRGVLSIAGSKLYFLLAGYAAQLFLPRLLRTPEAFGLFSTALSFVSILNNLLVGATIQVVSKRVSEKPEHAPYALRQALELQLAIGVILGGLLLGFAPILAERVLLDPLLTPLFRLASVVVLAYALYTAVIGALNGRQNFLAQARFDMGYTTLRTGCMLGAAALGFGAVGAFGGFALASTLVLLASLAFVGAGKSGQRSPFGEWIRFMAPLWLYQLCLNAIMQIDVTLLKRSVAELLQAKGVQALQAADTASRYVGFYRAAQTFAFVPYQLIISVSFVIFPMVSEALSLGDEAAARRYIQGALRFSLLVLLLVAAPFAGAARGVMLLVYPADYAAGAPALAVLALGMVCFALFVIAATIMTGAGRPGLAALVALFAVIVVVIANLVLVHRAGVGEHTLLAAALGTALGTVLSCAAMGTAVFARFKTFIPVATALRSLTAAAVGFGVSHLLVSNNRLLVLVALAAGASAYAITLAALRELGSADLQAVLRVLRRKRSTS
jgi:stage V sporulation protein B